MQAVQPLTENLAMLHSRQKLFLPDPMDLIGIHILNDSNILLLQFGSVEGNINAIKKIKIFFYGFPTLFPELTAGYTAIRKYNLI